MAHKIKTDDMTDIIWINKDDGCGVGKYNGRKVIFMEHSKYIVMFDMNNSFPMHVFRNGEEYRNVLGDNLIFWMATTINDAAEAIDKAAKAAEAAKEQAAEKTDKKAESTT